MHTDFCGMVTDHSLQSIHNSYDHGTELMDKGKYLYWELNLIAAGW